jgi:hypothetical protein
MKDFLAHGYIVRSPCGMLLFILALDCEGNVEGKPCWK